MRDPLLNFEGAPGVLLLNFEGGPGVLLLNFRGGGTGPESQGPEVPGPGSWSHFCSMPFFNDENHAQIVFPGKKKLIRPHVLKHEWMEAAFAVLIFVYTRRKKAWIKFFMSKTINTESFIEAWKEERRLWDVNSVIFKNRYKKALSRKKLAKQFRALVFVLASHTSLD